MGPRIFGIPAARAPVVAVIRRGPTRWSHLGRWDLATGRYEPGAWIAANLYPQRSDLSPDGRWFAYFTLKGAARWKAGPTYIAISRLPWLRALAAWRTCGTWTQGVHFVEDRTVWQVGPPDEGDAAPCRTRFGIALTRPATFAVERRRGWTETPDSPPRAPDDMWDERRVDRLRMEKAQPGSGGAVWLVSRGWYAAFRVSLPGWPKDAVYELVSSGESQRLVNRGWSAPWSSLFSASRRGSARTAPGRSASATRRLPYRARAG